jgi:hypothetical protein
MMAEPLQVRRRAASSGHQHAHSRRTVKVAGTNPTLSPSPDRDRGRAGEFEAFVMQQGGDRPANGDRRNQANLKRQRVRKDAGKTRASSTPSCRLAWETP